MLCVHDMRNLKEAREVVVQYCTVVGTVEVWTQPASVEGFESSDVVSVECR